MMTNWLPDLSQGVGPLYLKLAARIEDDIQSGVLPAGAKLPPQRNLAFDIGVTIGTVGRAYALVRERGLVSGEVGRGTYVLGRGAADEAGAGATSVAGAPGAMTDALRTARPVAGKIRMDSTAAPDVGQGPTLERLMSELIKEHPRQGRRRTPVNGRPPGWRRGAAGSPPATGGRMPVASCRRSADTQPSWR